MRGIAKTGETPVTEFLDKRVRGAWDVANRHLATRDFMLGTRPTIADISMSGYVFYDGEFGIDIAEFPALAAWRERVRALPGWKHPYDLMPAAPLPEKF
jgi:glutathione S-transferase